MAVTAAVVFVLVGVSFWSIMIPLRAVFSIGMTLAFVYGCVGRFPDAIRTYKTARPLSLAVHGDASPQVG